MPKTKEQKAEILQELVDKFGKSKTVVFSDYRGLDVSGISDLRSKLREKDAEYKIAKKTLIRLAAKDNKIDEIASEAMEGPVGVTFSYEDELSGLQVLFKFSKTNENLKLLGGIIEGKVVGPDVIAQYAQLPSKEELIAKLIGSAKSPITGTVGILGNLISSLVRVISAYKDTLPAEEAPAPAVEEKPAEEAAPEAPVESETPEVPAEEAKTDTEEKTEVSAETPAEETPAEEPAVEAAPAEESKPAEETPEEESGDAPSEEEVPKEAA